MELTGSANIAAPRKQVWAALNDPEILKAAIPGCESITQLSPTELEAEVTAKVGPVKAKFKGKVTLSELDPPNSYVISGEGTGGAAGFARGSARVSLEDDGEGTLLRYSVEAQVGGKLAQIGSRLVDGAAKKLAREFFEAFADILAPDQGDDQADGAVDPVETSELDERRSTAVWIWAGLVIALAAVSLAWYANA